MARDKVVPFNQRTDSGRLGFRDPEIDTFEDGRPVLIRSQFWENEAERLTYEAVVQKNPRSAGEGPLAYLERLSAAVTGVYQAAGQKMPRRGMSQRQWRERAWEVKKAGGHAHYVEE